MIVLAIALYILSGILFAVLIVGTVAAHRERAALRQVYRTARSAEWRLQQLGQQALAEMLDIARAHIGRGLDSKDREQW